MGLMDSIRKALSSGSMRDRHGDREAGRDPKLGADTPSGNTGPGGTAMDNAQKAGGAMEPDPPKDLG